MSELTDGLRKMADFLDTAPDHRFHVAESFDTLVVFVQNEGQLESVCPLLVGLTPRFDDPFTKFTYVAGLVSLEFNVKTELIAEKAEIGTAPVYGYQLKSSAA